MKIVTALRIPAILLPLFLGLAGCAETPAKPPPAAEEIEVPEYRIGVDDQLQVNVWRNPELSVNVPVRQDGMISVPLIGDVTAGGRRRKIWPARSKSASASTCWTPTSPCW